MLKRLAPTQPSAGTGARISKDFGGADGLLLLTVLFWGVNFAVVKVALVEIPPLVFNGLRFLLAAGLMLLLTRLGGHRLHFQRRHLPHFIGLALLGTTTYQLLFILGVARTTADNSSLILATVPAWVALFGTLSGLERVGGRGWLGVLLSLAGIILIIGGGNRQVQLQFGGATLLGDALILGATLSWTAYTLLMRPLTRHYPAMTLTSVPTLLGTVPLLLVSLEAMRGFDLAGVGLGAWTALVFSGIFGITLAYFFWNNGVSRLGSARTSLYSNLVPPITLLTAWLWLGETLTLMQWAGTLLALTGVILARRNTQAVRK